MSGSKLDQLVKGAPPPGTSIPSVVSRSSSPAPPLEHTHDETATGATVQVSLDPLSTLPSSPHQIYLNLLIIEASLRSQYLTLRARRRQHTFFLLLLAIWNVGFFYALFLRPREDGNGVGGSVYWVVEVAEKVALMGGVLTGVLVWGTGQWERGVRWPRRWVAIANRGLRIMNVKVVVIKGPWWKELLGYLSFLFPFFASEGLSYHYVDQSIEKHAIGHGSGFAQDVEAGREEDLSPGGDFVKLLLLPKPFSPDFRENWEHYRSEYWERENERRADLRQSIRKRERQVAKEQGSWFWWLGWQGRRRVQDLPENFSGGEKPYLKHLSEKKRRPSLARTESHSRTTSRSSTPSTIDPEERPTSHRVRRSSTSNTGSSERRKKTKYSSSDESMRVSKLTPLT